MTRKRKVLNLKDVNQLYPPTKDKYENGKDDVSQQS